MRVILLCLIFIMYTILEMSNSKRTNREENFFYAINTRLQDTVNKLFILTKLNKTFAMDFTNRMHLTMHASMKSIAEKYYVSLRKANSSSRMELNFKPNKTLFNLDETLDELLKKESTLNYTNRFIKKLPNLFAKSTKFTFREKSTDPVLFLREYLSTIKHLNLGDLAAPSEHIHKIFLNLTKSRNRTRRKMELSLWKPRNLSEFDIHETRRLYNGRRTRIKSYPFVVSVHLRNNFICTGSILSTEMVITAASCLHELFKNKLYLHLNPESVGVRVGSEFVDKDGLWVYIDKVFFNPTYNPTTLTGNLAIMRTSSLLHLKKKNRRVKRIGYQRSEGFPRPSINTIVMLGWGDINKELQENIETPLKFSRIPLYDFNECTIIYSNKFVSDKHFCAGYSNERSGACKRDVGGPAVVEDKLFGVVSFGPPVCGTPDAPTVFTNIGYYASWIDSVIKGNSNKVHLPMRTSFMGNSSAVVRSHQDIPPDMRYIYPRQKRPRDHRLSRIKPAMLKQKPLKRTGSSSYIETIKLLAFVITKFLSGDINDYDFPDYEVTTDPVHHMWTTTPFDPRTHPLYQYTTTTLRWDQTTSRTTEPTTESRFKYTFPKLPPVPSAPPPRPTGRLRDALSNGLHFDYTERTTNGEVYSNDDETEYFEQTEPTVATMPKLKWRPTQRVQLRTYPPTKRNWNVFVDRAHDILNKNFKNESSEIKMTDQPSIAELFKMLFTATPYSEQAKLVITSNWEISLEDIPLEFIKRTKSKRLSTPVYRNMHTSSQDTNEDFPPKPNNVDSSEESVDSEFKGMAAKSDELLSSSEIAAVHNESLESEEGIPIEFRRYFAEPAT